MKKKTLLLSLVFLLSSCRYLPSDFLTSLLPNININQSSQNSEESSHDKNSYSSSDIESSSEESLTSSSNKPSSSEKPSSSTNKPTSSEPVSSEPTSSEPVSSEPSSSERPSSSSRPSSSEVSSERPSSSSNKPSSSEPVSSESSSSSSSSEKPNEAVIDFYAINDFHGRILEDSSEKVPGISKLTTYLKKQKEKNEEGYVFINSGDYWQDTYDSASNKGELLTKCLDVMECEAIALGNHEFDWGQSVIKNNKELVSYTSFLGANIYNYPSTSEKSDLGDNYKVIERSGIKIGIIGGIGDGQITSITSSNWTDLTFKTPDSIVQSLSDELRTEKDCDIVVLSIHADQDDAYQDKITQVSSVSGKRYVDAVFCAHSHQLEISTYNNVPFIQGGAHGKQVSHVQLKYKNGNVTTTYCANDGYGQINSYSEDPEINEIIDSYFDSTYVSNKNQVMGTISSSGGYISTNYIGRIQAKATYDALSNLGYDVDIVLNNGGRASSDSGQMTREAIFNMTPFTNYTYVVKNIKGSDIKREAVTYPNPYYWANPSEELDETATYTVACIDYMMLHKNKYRSYDYFKTYKEANVEYILKDYPNVIIEKYLQKNKTINISSYNSTNYTCLGS